MYSTCLFCHAALGTNESIEHFPVGRRLAFDGVKGRLWVICGACERWNLTPIDERWEAIEECERAFRASRLRVSTDNVGMARLREGTTLVRIGEPQRPELAAWRYGDQFGRRRRRHVVTTTAIVAAVAGIVVAGPVTGLVSGGAVNLINAGNLVRRFRSVARVTVGGERYNLSRQALLYVELRPNEESGYELEVPFMWPLNTRLSLFAHGAGHDVFGRNGPSLTLSGDEAVQAARTLLPRINASGGSASAVREAVGILEQAPEGIDLLARAAAASRRHRLAWMLGGGFPLGANRERHPISALPAAQRLALEMSLHEADERRALEGDLAVLEQRWKEAEEIAAISDDMFLPQGIIDRLRRLKDR